MANLIMPYPPEEHGLPHMSLKHMENFDTATYEPNPIEKTLKFTNGDVYQGETFADLRHGKGKHVCSNGDTHEGGWYKGMRHGFGTASFARGFSYEGTFQYDHAHGSGKARYETGAVYDGEFADDKRCGWGVQCFPDESVYEGEWENDSMQGNGRLTVKDGAYYEGKWKAGHCTSGVWKSHDRQQEYRGEWVNGQKHGKGVLLVAGMFHYQGSWENDVQEGPGKCRWADGTVYDGNWHAGQRHGKGKLVKVDSYKYDGQWENDRQHGRGNVHLANGDRYHGEFLNGEPHGQGRSRSLEGDRYEGEMKHGKRHGKGRCAYADGSRYQGDWVNNKRHGQGTCHFSNGNVFKGEWQEDHWVQSEAEPSLCRVAGQGLSKCTAAEPATFTILARDNLGNRRLSGGDRFLVWLEGRETVHGHVTDHDDGYFVATYTANITGLYELYITNETGESVAEAPFPVRVFAGPADPKRSCVKPVRGVPYIIHKPCKFVVELRDSHDNRCGNGRDSEELPIEPEASCGNATCVVHIVPTTGGTYHCHFTPSAAGYYRVSVTSGSHQLRHSPLSIKVTDPAASDEALGDGPGVTDKLKEWESKAAQQFRADGNADGWESDSSSQPETAEQKYIREHPNVPVVTNMEDMWKVTKLQRERKKIQEKAKAMKEMAELQQHHEQAPQAHPERAPMIGRGLQRASHSGKDFAPESEAPSSPSPSPNQSSRSPKNGGVDSIEPQESMFTETAYAKTPSEAPSNSRKGRLDEAGMLTQLSEISDVSSLSSKLTHMSFGKGPSGRGSSTEVDFESFK